MMDPFFESNASGFWPPGVDQYALLVAALCHDIGHQGRTNPFLVRRLREEIRHIGLYVDFCLKKHNKYEWL